MESYDIIMLVVLIGATLFGAWKGMAWQIASLASVGLSYFLSLRFSQTLAPLFGEKAPLNRFAAMLVIYLATSICVWLGFRFVHGMIDRVKLREFDRQLGAMFGAVKGVLLCVVITFFAVSLAPPATTKNVVNSRSGKYIAILLDRAGPLLPPEIHDILDPYLNPLEKQLGPTEPLAETPADKPI